MSVAIGQTEGYPHALQIDVEYVLSDKGLRSRVTARNTGKTTAPYGVCPHPYLIAGESPLDEWSLKIPARSFLEVTSDRLLPKKVRSVEDHEFDFRTGRVIGATEIDHAFTDIAFDETGHARLELQDPIGTGVGMTWDRSCQWLQIHTADKAAPAANPIGLAVEPMTCPPDAFNSAVSLLRLEPGEDHEASWSIYAAGD